MPRRTRRTFTPQFKAQVVLELLTGQHSPAELCRQHQLSPSLLTLWKDTLLGLCTIILGLVSISAMSAQDIVAQSEFEQFFVQSPLLERLPVLFQDDARLDQQQTRVAELEQLVGRQALELEIPKKASRLLPGNADRNGRWS